MRLKLTGLSAFGQASAASASIGATARNPDVAGKGIIFSVASDTCDIWASGCYLYNGWDRAFVVLLVPLFIGFNKSQIFKIKTNIYIPHTHYPALLSYTGEPGVPCHLQSSKAGVKCKGGFTGSSSALLQTVMSRPSGLEV